MEATRPPENADPTPQDAAREDRLCSLDCQSDSDDKDAGQSTPVNAMSTSPERYDGRDFRPPFEQGHTLSTKHGAYSDRVVSAKATEIEPAFHAWLAEHAAVGSQR